MSVYDPSANPYPGPEAFREKQANLFFGREREVKDLLYTVLANRLVLFSAPSGAGKSSLINTRLRPMLKEEGFEVLETARVTGELPPYVEEVENVFVFDLISDIHEDLGKTPSDISPLADLGLIDYLASYRPACLDSNQEEPRAQVLIIDQFEEVFTSHRPEWRQREDFFSQLGQAIASDQINLWVVLAMRQDHVTEMERYAHLLPGRLRARYYMERLNGDRASKAITGPAGERKVTYEEQVVKRLRSDLCQERQGGEQSSSFEGEFVELVQLQVVCRQLWKELNPGTGQTIIMEDLKSIADEQNVTSFVDNALARFYADAIHVALAKTDISEYRLRNWIDTELITPTGRRSHVFRGPKETGGISNAVIDALKSNLLVREETSSGRRFVELIHDRLARPILKANRKWYRQYAVIPLYRDWRKSKRDQKKLIGGPILQEALEEDLTPLGDDVAEFIHRSQDAQKRRKQVELLERERTLKLEHAQEVAELESKRAAKARELRQEAEARSEEAVAHQREQEQAKRTERQLKWIAILAACCSIIFAISALLSWHKADRLGRHLLTSYVEEAFETNPELGLIISVEATEMDIPWLRKPSARAGQALVDAMTAHNSKLLIPVVSEPDLIPDIHRATVSINGHLVAAAIGGPPNDTKTSVQMWDLRDIADPSSKAIVQGTYDDGPVTAMAFSQDSLWLAFVHEDGVFRLMHNKDAADSTGFSEVYSTTEVATIGFIPTEARIALGTVDGEVRMLDIGNGTKYETLDRPLVCDKVSTLQTDSELPQRRAIRRLIASMDGQWLATVFESDDLCLWKNNGYGGWDSTLLKEGQEKGEKQYNDYDLVAFSADGKLLATAGLNKSPVRLWDLNNLDGGSLEVDDKHSMVADVSSLVFGGSRFHAKDGWSARLAIGYSDGMVLLLDLAESNIRAAPVDPFIPTRENSLPAAEQIRRIEDDKPQEWFNSAKKVSHLKFHSPSGRRLAVLYADNTSQIFDTEWERFAYAHQLYGCDVKEIFFGADQKTYITMTDSGMQIWETENPPGTVDEVQKMQENACKQVNYLALSSTEGKLLFDDESYKSVCQKMTAQSLE